MISILKKIISAGVLTSILFQFAPYAFAQVAGTEDATGEIITSAGETTAVGTAAGTTVITEAETEGKAVGGTLSPFVANCVPATAGTSPGGIGPIPSTPAFSGICEQNVIIGEEIGTIKAFARAQALTDAQAAAKDKFDVLKVIKETLKIVFAQQFKQHILDQLVNKIIDWINGGFKGGIIADWNEFLQDAGENALASVIEDSGLGFLCSPFNIQIQALLAPVPRFGEQITCTLGDIQRNIEGFFENFETGGWIGYTQLWQPQNNFYGVTLIAANEAIKRQDAFKEAAKNEGIAGQGFKSKYKCTDPTDASTCEIVTPGTVVGAAASKYIVNNPVDWLIQTNDLAAYLAAIANAAINQVIRLTVDGIRDSVADVATDISADCSGLSGPARNACLGFANTFDSGLEDDKTQFVQVIEFYHLQVQYF